MTAKKVIKEIKKPVKKEVKKTEIIKEVKKEIKTINFPTITKTTVNNFEINWFSLSRTFKSKFKFIYDIKKNPSVKAEPKYLNNKSIITITKINWRWILDNFNFKIKKYYECYILIWDYYINKNQGYDLNKRIMEIMNYDC